jgi:aryl-alcohol dehydrogenase-like predicted oxidoreductase
MAVLATPEGTARYAARHPEASPGHWRALRGLKVGSIGMGTYLGREDDAADEAYAEAARTALRAGCNVLDTAINYRTQRSERALGRALREAAAAGEVARDEVVLCTKGGYLPVRSERELYEEYLRPGILAPVDIVGGVHAMSPRYLRDQLARSLRNLGVEAVDAYYVHNPEHALGELPRDEFEGRLLAAFTMLEEACDEGRVGSYGVATWNGLRAPPEAEEHLSLERLLALAREAARGKAPRFAVVQAPLNLGMTEALAVPTQALGGRRVPLLDAARALGLGVVASASLLQGRLAQRLPGLVEGVLGLGSDAHRALQFARSCPGVTVALVGMGRPEHARANLALAREAPAGADDVRMLFEAARRAA